MTTSLSVSTEPLTPNSAALSTPKVECASESQCTFDLQADLTKSPHYHESDVYKLRYFVCLHMFTYVTYIKSIIQFLIEIEWYKHYYCFFCF